MRVYFYFVGLLWGVNGGRCFYVFPKMNQHHRYYAEMLAQGKFFYLFLCLLIDFLCCECLVLVYGVFWVRRIMEAIMINNREKDKGAGEGVYKDSFECFDWCWPEDAVALTCRSSWVKLWLAGCCVFDNEEDNKKIKPMLTAIRVTLNHGALVILECLFWSIIENSRLLLNPWCSVFFLRVERYWNNTNGLVRKCEVVLFLLGEFDIDAIKLVAMFGVCWFDYWYSAGLLTSSWSLCKCFIAYFSHTLPAKNTWYNSWSMWFWSRIFFKIDSAWLIFMGCL